jgi:hypothetical protein
MAEMPRPSSDGEYMLPSNTSLAFIAALASPTNKEPATAQRVASFRNEMFTLDFLRDVNWVLTSLLMTMN